MSYPHLDAIRQAFPPAPRSAAAPHAASRIRRRPGLQAMPSLENVWHGTRRILSVRMPRLFSWPAVLSQWRFQPQPATMQSFSPPRPAYPLRAPNRRHTFDPESFHRRVPARTTSSYRAGRYCPARVPSGRSENRAASPREDDECRNRATRYAGDRRPPVAGPAIAQNARIRRAAYFRRFDRASVRDTRDSEKPMFRHPRSVSRLPPHEPPPQLRLCHAYAVLLRVTLRILPFPRLTPENTTLMTAPPSLVRELPPDADTTIHAAIFRPAAQHFSMAVYR